MKTVKQLLEQNKYGQDHLSKMDSKRSASYPSEKEIPTVIILKRKAIRVFPDNQKIAMYYSQALDKYISIPYGPKNEALGMHLSEGRYPKIDTSEVDPEVLKHPDVQELIDRRKPRKVTTQDILKRLPDSHPLNIGTKQGRKGLRQKALKGYFRGNMSGAAAAGKILGTAAVGAGQAIKKAYQKLTKEETEVTKSFRDKLKTLREDTYTDENLLLEKNIALELLKKGITSSAGKIKKRPLPGGKKKLDSMSKTRRSRLKFRRRQDLNFNLGGNNNNDENSRQEPSGETAWEAGRRRGIEATTPSKEYDIGRRELAKAGSNREVWDDPRYQFGLRRISATVNEESNLSKIQKISKKKNASKEITIGESTITINSRIAKKIMKIYESLNESNKNKIDKMLNEDIVEVRKLINFAIKA